MLQLGETERFHQRRDVHAETAAQAFFQPVPAADGILGRTAPGLHAASAAGFCSSALPSGIQSPCALSMGVQVIQAAQLVAPARSSDRAHQGGWVG